jgi:3-(3-hydroxy-phenyl)propionate hydroxylase
VQDGEDERVLLTDEAIWDILRARGVTEDHVRIVRAVVYSHHVRVADRWRVGRTFLAGDAAHAMPPWIGQGMSAGVRDMSNLCWKLAAVLRGQAPESLLDSYQAERKPHVTEVTRRAVLVGRVINERRRALASLRNHVLRALSKVPGLVTRAQRFWWIPDARYRDGFLAPGHPAVGWQLPQPLVQDATGATVRFDDAVGGQWALLHIGAPPVGARSWAELGVPRFELSGPGSGHRAGAIVDTSGALTGWMRAKKARTVVLRPDGFIYAAAAFGHQLPAPPAGLAHPAAPATVTPIRLGVTA